MKREYKYSESMENYGRLSSNGMQGVMREFRGFLMGQTTTDLDEENSHPVILSYICHKNGIKCDAIDEYNNNRDRVLETFLPITRSDAKCELLKCINRDIHNKNNKNLFYKKWDKDIRRIQLELLQVEEYKHIYDTVPADKEYNKVGSQMSRISKNIIQTLSCLKGGNLKNYKNLSRKIKKRRFHLQVLKNTYLMI
jgi:hypothetical protein